MLAIVFRVKFKTKVNFFNSLFLCVFISVNRSLANNTPITPIKLDFSTPIKTLTPETYPRLPPTASIKRSRANSTMIPSVYETPSPPPAQPISSNATPFDSSEYVISFE